MNGAWEGPLCCVRADAQTVDQKLNLISLQRTFVRGSKPILCCRGLTLAEGQMPTQALAQLCSKIGGENRMRKLMGQDKGMEVAFQLMSWAKINSEGEKQRQTPRPHLSSSLSQGQLHCFALDSSIPKQWRKHRGQFVVNTYQSLLLLPPHVFPLLQQGLCHRLQSFWKILLHCVWLPGL